MVKAKVPSVQLTEDVPDENPSSSVIPTSCQRQHNSRIHSIAQSPSWDHKSDSEWAALGESQYVDCAKRAYKVSSVLCAGQHEASRQLNSGTLTFCKGK